MRLLRPSFLECVARCGSLNTLQDDILLSSASHASAPHDAGLAEEAAECEQLRVELSEVESHCARLPAQNQLLQQTLERDTRELQLQESGVYRKQAACYKLLISCASHDQQSFCAAALANKESLREGKLQAVREALDVYRERLGLHFRKGTVTCSPFCHSACPVICLLTATDARLCGCRQGRRASAHLHPH